MIAPQDCAVWSQACIVAALVALCIVLTLLLRNPRGGSHLRERIAVREEFNGRMLLRIAEEMEALSGELDGVSSARRHRAWARACRRAAVDHLACINLLLLEPGAGHVLEETRMRERGDAP